MDQIITSSVRAFDGLLSQVLLFGFIAFLLCALGGKDGTPVAKAVVELFTTVVVLALKTAIALFFGVLRVLLRTTTLFHPEWQATLDHVFGPQPKPSSGTHGKKTTAPKTASEPK